MSDRPLRVLGVDPGLTRCGIGVVDGPPARPSLVATELVRTPSDAPLARRLQRLYRAVTEAVDAHRPDAVACEQVLFTRNVSTALGTAQAAGMALLAAAEAGLPVELYTPTDVKLAVAGFGDASKTAIGRMVAAQLRLDATPTPADVSDALAVAICHLSRARVAAAVADTPAGNRLATAAASARSSARGGWEGLLARRNLRVAGGTAPQPKRGGDR